LFSIYRAVYKSNPAVPDQILQNCKWFVHTAPNSLPKSHIQCGIMTEAKTIRKLAAIVLLPFSLAASLLALPQVPLDTPDEAPNFYFTRLVYTQNPYSRRGGRATMAPPAAQFQCPEFGGGNFFPFQGWGWATDYPGGDCKFMGAIHRLTGIRVHYNPHVMQILDKDLL